MSNNVVLNIDTTAVKNYTRTLEQMHRSALPSAIRGTLNDAAFDTKTRSMPKHADSEFVKRAPNFFKANSRFEKAVGFNINTMKSTIGFTENGLKGGNNYAVKDLEQQEHGGTIERKSFIPLPDARIGRSRNKLVRSNARLSEIKNIVHAKNAKGKNPKEKFVKSVIHAGQGGIVLAEYKGKEILWRVNSLNKNKGNKFKLTAMYSFSKGRSFNVDSKHFMRDASIDTTRRMDDFYIKQATYQINKIRK